MEALEASGLRVYSRRAVVAARATPMRFTTEVRPAFDAMRLDMLEAARRLPLSDEIKSLAARAALNLLTEREIRTELFAGESAEEQVQAVTDRTALFERTRSALESLGLEEQDHVDLIGELAKRLAPEIERAHAYRDETLRPAAIQQSAQARDAACWIIHMRLPELQEVLYAQWASNAREAPSQPLPDALLMPAGTALAPSRKNIYGVLFPEIDAVVAASNTLPSDAQRWFRTETYMFTDDDAKMLSVARLDAAYEFNTKELAFAKALDRADFVAWWHRNPQGKPYSVALLRADSRHLFYPDFVVCLQHEPGDVPLVRLVETKHDVKDASRKAQRQSKSYGKVLFLTKDGTRFKIVEDNGSLGDVVDFDDLNRLRQWMRDSALTH